jgi:eukaryotic-like serine/threonine-protein kinase
MKREANDDGVAREPKRTVTDENGAAHTLVRRLGVGGQGEVWLSGGGRRVVKLLSRAGDREALRRRIAVVKRMDLQRLHVAKPLSLLRAPDVGYVAEFLDDMMPIGKLMAPPRGARVASWYGEQGGLRRRLRLLAHAGEALAGLHARGLIYGDVSHHNVFVSAPPEAHEAWLIDLDNLRHDSDLETAVYTAGYGAPEVIQGKAGPSSLSDAWGFAVLAFQMLTLVHPFIGDLVHDGEPELEEAAFAGQLPWIDHPTDPRNRSTQGLLPRSLVLGKQLAKLAQDTFDHGLSDRLRRPGIGAWVERLHRAADQTLCCSRCRRSYFVTHEVCPWCDAPRERFLRVGIHRWEPGKGIVIEMKTVEKLPLAHEQLSLSRRITRGESGVEARRVDVILERQESGVRVRSLHGEAWVTRPGVTDAAKALPIDEGGRVLPIHSTPERSFVIHFSPVGSSHRVATVCEGAA